MNATEKQHRAHGEERGGQMNEVIRKPFDALGYEIRRKQPPPPPMRWEALEANRVIRRMLSLFAYTSRRENGRQRNVSVRS